MRFSTELTIAGALWLFLLFWATTVEWMTPAPPDCALYPPLQTPALRSTLVRMLRHWKEAMERADVDYAIAYGTALGYARHNGSYIPWDDDTDVLVRPEHSDRARSAISEPYCTLPFWGGWKMFPCAGERVGTKPWRYPFIDVFDNVKGGNKRNRYNSAWSIMFPSRPIVFEGLDLRGPRDLGEHLRLKFGDTTMCTSPHWDHVREVGVAQHTWPCAQVLEACGFD